MLLDLRSLWEAAVSGDVVLVSVVDSAPATESVALAFNPLLAAVGDDDNPADAVDVRISVMVVVAEADPATETVALLFNPLLLSVFDADAPAEAVAAAISMRVEAAENPTSSELVALSIQEPGPFFEDLYLGNASIRETTVVNAAVVVGRAVLEAIDA